MSFILPLSTRTIVITFVERQKRLLSLAFPLIVANITTPILGLVDTAILGRMDGLYYLAGASIASLIITQVYWICGFLKMSLTGLSAQADENNAQQRVDVLLQGLVASVLLAFIILLFNQYILSAGIWFIGESANTISVTRDYFETRIFGAPAALANLVFVGWLIGQQMTKQVLYVQIVLNIVNIIASLLLVYGFAFGVKGVALGSVLAEYFGAFCYLYLIARSVRGESFALKLPSWDQMSVQAKLNSDIFIRNLALQFTLAFITLIGVSYGTSAAAVNAIIMQFFALIALGLDGVANAVESLVGKAKGKNDVKSLKKEVNAGLIWSSVIALLYAFIFLLFDQEILRLLSDQEALYGFFKDYHFIVILLPVIAHWCFLFDGIYVGLTDGKTMRNTMLISCLLGFLPVYYLLADSMQNQALWIAMLSFLAWRGASLSLHFWVHLKRYPNTALFNKN